MKIFFKVLIFLFSFYNLQKPSSLLDPSIDASKTMMNNSMHQQSGAFIYRVRTVPLYFSWPAEFPDNNDALMYKS